MSAESPPYWLSLLGNSGAGKTFLVKQMGLTIYPWYEVANWARTQEKTKAGYDRPPVEKFLELAQAKYPVVLDDIGSEYVTDFTKCKLLEFLNRREDKWTIITANMSLEQISKELDPRIASRMLRHDSVVIEVDVPDFNLRVSQGVVSDTVKTSQEI